MEALQSLVSWIASRLQSSTSTSLALVTPALAVLIAAPEARKLFDQAGGIGFLVRHLRVRQAGPKKNSASVQHLYELCFCLWIMTYECSTSEEMRCHFHRDQAVFALVVSLV
jgi:V-type H+-transporting ATPase subunit H